jgi:hypothetical protein
MDWLWTWGGISLGYKVDDRVFTHFGLQIGRVDGEEVYASDGRYWGEIMSDNRLITHRGKKNYRHSGFSPTRSGSYARYANYAGYAMYAGYEDFPSPDAFK